MGNAVLGRPRTEEIKVQSWIPWEIRLFGGSFLDSSMILPLSFEPKTIWDANNSQACYRLTIFPKKFTEYNLIILIQMNIFVQRMNK